MILPQCMEPVSVFLGLVVWRLIGLALELYAIYDLVFRNHF